MAKKIFKSKRLDKEFELEVCEAAPGAIVGDGSDISIVRASALEELLYELGGAVTWSWKEVEDKGIIFEISDDTGVHVAGTGDWNAFSLKDRVAKAFPLATAWSRAMSAAVVKYFGFEGRVYSDASFEVLEDEPVKPASSKKAPAKKSEPKDSTDDENPVISEITESEAYPSDWVFTVGAGKGMTLAEIAEADDHPNFARVRPRTGLTKGLSYLLYMYESKKAATQNGGSEEQLRVLKQFLGDLVK